MVALIGTPVKRWGKPVIGLWLALWFGLTAADDLTLAENLAAQCGRAAADNKVCLVYVSQVGCSFCARLERDVLRPLQNVEALIAKVLVIELPWVERSVTNFKGQRQATEALLQDLGVAGAPTLLFLDGQGRVLAKPLIGYQSPDYFWFYFEKAIHQAQQALLDGSFWQVESADSAFMND